jgi:hypothetical protein
MMMKTTLGVSVSNGEELDLDRVYPFPPDAARDLIAQLADRLLGAIF